MGLSPSWERPGSAFLRRKTSLLGVRLLSCSKVILTAEGRGLDSIIVLSLLVLKQERGKARDSGQKWLLGP